MIAILAVSGAVFALTPGTPDKIASDVPAKLIWDFRIAYLAQLGLDVGHSGHGPRATGLDESG